MENWLLKIKGQPAKTANNAAKGLVGNENYIGKRWVTSGTTGMRKIQEGKKYSN